VDVETILRGAADLLLIVGNGYGGTTASFDGIAVITTGTGVRVAVAIDHVHLSCPFVTSLGLWTGGTSKEKTLRIA
jgi:hypothetical protein